MPLLAANANTVVISYRYLFRFFRCYIISISISVQGLTEKQDQAIVVMSSIDSGSVGNPSQASKHIQNPSEIVPVPSCIATNTNLDQHHQSHNNNQQDQDTVSVTGTGNKTEVPMETAPGDSALALYNNESYEKTGNFSNSDDSRSITKQDHNSSNDAVSRRKKRLAMNRESARSRRKRKKVLLGSLSTEVYDLRQRLKEYEETIVPSLKQKNQQLTLALKQAGAMIANYVAAGTPNASSAAAAAAATTTLGAANPNGIHNNGINNASAVINPSRVPNTLKQQQQQQQQASTNSVASTSLFSLQQQQRHQENALLNLLQHQKQAQQQQQQQLLPHVATIAPAAANGAPAATNSQNPIASLAARTQPAPAAIHPATASITNTLQDQLSSLLRLGQQQQQQQPQDAASLGLILALQQQQAQTQAHAPAPQTAMLLQQLQQQLQQQQQQQHAPQIQQQQQIEALQQLNHLQQQQRQQGSAQVQAQQQFHQQMILSSAMHAPSSTTGGATGSDPSKA